MPGKWITDKQVKIYMESREIGNTQALSSAKSGISIRTGRGIEQGKRKSAQGKERHWRTRPDPLESVWTSELEPMLRGLPELQAITLLEYLQTKYPGEYGDKLLRTLQRRVKHWRRVEGPPLEVMFRQTHAPGQQCLSDFTTLKRVKITLCGKTFKHMLYHFRLCYSKWSDIKVVCGGESFTALAEGLQNALARLGGSPKSHRTDSLSAAFKNLSRATIEDMTSSYEALCAHYQMKSSRNNPGRGHENGAIEAAHGHIKRRIEQSLLLRGSTDFATIEAYQQFIDEVVVAHNKRNAKALAVERPYLQPLPVVKAMDYTPVQAVVTSSSTIDVRRITYTVPSQLQGQTLQIRLYDNRLECYLGHTRIVTLQRIYPTGKTLRARLIDYRHVIHSLVKKPQAFRYSRLRDDLLPNEDYRKIWHYVDSHMGAKSACRFIVGLLHLAATQNCEAALADAVLTKMTRQQTLTLSALQAQFGHVQHTTVPTIEVNQHALQTYDALTTGSEVNYE